MEHERRATSQRRSNRNLHLQSDNQSIVSTNNNNKCSAELVDANATKTTTTTEHRNDLILSNCTWHCAEDFMLRAVGEQILALIPSCCSTTSRTKWSPSFDSDTHSTEIVFTKAKNSGHIGVARTNPLIDNAPSGMRLSDCNLGFGKHDHGFSIVF